MCFVVFGAKVPVSFVYLPPSLPASGHQGPAWLPAAFQHVSYLVAPPKTKAQLEQEQADRDFNGIREDPMVNVDMTPWYLVKTNKIKQIRFVPNRMGWRIADLTQIYALKCETIYSAVLSMASRPSRWCVIHVWYQKTVSLKRDTSGG